MVAGVFREYSQNIYIVLIPLFCNKMFVVCVI